MSDLSFMAKSWHFIFLETTNPAKTTADELRFETVYNVASLFLLKVSSVFFTKHEKEDKIPSPFFNYYICFLYLNQLR